MRLDNPPAGQEAQIDFGLMGTVTDADSEWDGSSGDLASRADMISSDVPGPDEAHLLANDGSDGLGRVHVDLEPCGVVCGPLPPPPSYSLRGLSCRLP
ncbi:MAG TPA: hypothetical protein VHG72_22220 [Polyangia bacterium]|nr:hypothetical protein [Polyangia bacterium]